jgi:hypothetical protein
VGVELQTLSEQHGRGRQKGDCIVFREVSAAKTLNPKAPRVGVGVHARRDRACTRGCKLECPTARG